VSIELFTLHLCVKGMAVLQASLISGLAIHELICRLGTQVLRTFVHVALIPERHGIDSSELD
jgi:hypothetical protein